jgi:hypothetical protein
MWIYYFHYYKLQTDIKLFIDDVISHVKTGDLICFKAYNNFNSVFIGSYFGHVGIVYAPKGQEPMLFEANGIEYMNLRPHHPQTGMFCTPLAERVRKYKGACYWKPLDYPVEPHIEYGFGKFIEYCMKEFHYDVSVFQAGIRTGLGFGKCSKNTNCGEIVFLSLIKLGLLDVKEYDDKRFHYLRYVCHITELKNNKYVDLVMLVDHPFKD